MEKFRSDVQKAAAARLLFLPHAIKQMSRPDRLITEEEVEEVVKVGDIIEDYPEDPRGHSCLMLALPAGGALHVVCSPKGDYLAIITAYRPDPRQWTADYRKRLS